MRLKIAYRIGPEYAVGIEQYSDLGNTHKIGPLNQQSQQTFATVDFKRRDYLVEMNSKFIRDGNCELTMASEKGRPPVAMA